MSQSTSVPKNTCEHCDETHPVTELYQPVANGNFCGPECYFEYKGENVLTQIQNDHRFCRSCFRRQKTIERPPEWFLKDRPLTIRDSIVGFEYYTEHVEKDHGFTYCTCGSVNHRDEHGVLQSIERTTVIKNLALLLAEYHSEGQVPGKPDIETFVQTLNQTDNHALAIGKAIFDP